MAFGTRIRSNCEVGRCNLKVVRRVRSELGGVQDGSVWVHKEWYAVITRHILAVATSVLIISAIF